MSSNNYGTLASIPKIICPSLIFINIEKNCLKSLNFLDNCTNLKEIYAGNNNLTNVATNLIKLKSLQILDLSFNFIENFDSISLLSFNNQLRKISLTGNIIENKRDFKENFSKLFKNIELESFTEQVLYYILAKN